MNFDKIISFSDKKEHLKNKQSLKVFKEYFLKGKLV